MRRKPGGNSGKVNRKTSVIGFEPPITVTNKMMDPITKKAPTMTR